MASFPHLFSLGKLPSKGILPFLTCNAFQMQRRSFCLLGEAYHDEENALG